MGVGEERAAVGVVGAHADPPGVVDAEVPLQADGPLQGMDEVLVIVRDRDHAAAGFELDVTHVALSGLCRSCRDAPPAEPA